MIQIIQPRQYFPISRNIPNPADTSTYYIRAVIRRADNALVLATVDLTSQGNNLYANTWQAPVDPTGRGLFITITTSVYTDSGHTTKSDVYTEDSDTYLIYDQFSLVQGLATQISALISAPQGPDVDYKKIRKIFKEEISLIDIPIPKEFDTASLKPYFAQVCEKMASICAESDLRRTQTPTDLSPVIKAVSDASKSIMEAILAIPEPEKQHAIDLKPVIDRIDKIDLTKLQSGISEIGPLSTKIALMFTDANKKIDSVIPAFVSQMKGLLDMLELKLNPPPAPKPNLELNSSGKILIPRRKKYAKTP